MVKPATKRPGPKAVRAALRAHARPDKAEGMRAYLKSAMPCLGVQVPVARSLAKQLFGDSPCDDLGSLSRLVEQLWFSAEFREERFVAINVLRLRPHRALLTAKAAPLLETLIRSGAWWDLVDELSAHVVGVMLENDPKAMTKVLRRWAESDELWLKRSTLVCQVVRGEDTDLEVLEHAIEHSVDGKDFFLRKGIGWAMRSVGRKNPALVRRWLAKWKGRLSPLSVREARKSLR